MIHPSVPQSLSLSQTIVPSSSSSSFGSQVSGSPRSVQHPGSAQSIKSSLIIEYNTPAILLYQYNNNPTLYTQSKVRSDISFTYQNYPIETPRNQAEARFACWTCPNFHAWYSRSLSDCREWLNKMFLDTVRQLDQQVPFGNCLLVHSAGLNGVGLRGGVIFFKIFDDL